MFMNRLRRRTRFKVLNQFARKCRKRKSFEKRSCQNRMNHFAFHISQPEIAPIVLIGKAFVVQAQQIQNGRVDIVYGRRAFDYAKSDVVGHSIAHTPFDSSARHPKDEAFGIVVATIAALRDGQTSKLYRPK